MEAGQIRERRLTTAIILPPHEGFAPAAVGAIGLLVHRLVHGGAEGTVIGAPGAYAPFDDVPYLPAAPGFGLSGAARYANGVARVLRQLRPARIEVHNRPEIALRLARAMPGVPMLLWLNNDPQHMRRARTPADRTRIAAAMQVVTASAWLRDRFCESLSPTLVTVIPNCLEPLPASPVERENLIVFAGRIVADKGADAFVAACALALPDLPGWRAEMVGADRFSPTAPDTPFLTALRPAAAAAGVVLRGHMPHAAVLDAMRRAAIVVVPSRWPEPFGLVALEAMACGAALICSPRGGLPEVGGAVALYAEPEPDALAAAMVALARDPARRAALGEAGVMRSQQFGVDQAVAALVHLRQQGSDPRS